MGKVTTLPIKRASNPIEWHKIESGPEAKKPPNGELLLLVYREQGDDVPSFCFGFYSDKKDIFIDHEGTWLSEELGMNITHWVVPNVP